MKEVTAVSTKQRFYKYVGQRRFSRLPQGPIDHDTYQNLSPDLRHIVLHSGDWEAMTAAEVKDYKAKLAEAEKQAAAEAEKLAEEEAARIAAETGADPAGEEVSQ